MIMTHDDYKTTWWGIKLAYIFQGLPKGTFENVLDFYVFLLLGTNEKYRESLYCFTHSARLPIYPSTVCTVQYMYAFLLLVTPWLVLSQGVNFFSLLFGKNAWWVCPLFFFTTAHTLTLYYGSTGTLHKQLVAFCFLEVLPFSPKQQWRMMILPLHWCGSFWMSKFLSFLCCLSYYL